jgi:DNA-binding transcriptional ArsR family regulator
MVFQALSDPTRRMMIERLCAGPAPVSDLAKPLDMILSAVVQHLQVLEASGLVRSEKIGRVRTCSIDPDILSAAGNWIVDRQQDWQYRFK